MSTPSTEQQRITSLDEIRGFAVLGILIMNIQAFAMPEAAYTNPMAYGDLQGVNYVVWWFSNLFANTKFVTLFSLLFGAGILLFTDRLQAQGLQPALFHYRRMLALAVFGILHAYLIWEGDILFTYAVAGAAVYLWRHASARRLAVAGMVVLVAWLMLFALAQLGMANISPQDQLEMQQQWMPTAVDVAEERQTFTGSWVGLFQLRAERSWLMQTESLLWSNFWLTSSLMLIGMALYRSQLFSRTLTFRVKFFGGLLWLSGFALMWFEGHRAFAADWYWLDTVLINSLLTIPAALMMAIGYVIGLLWLAEQKRLSGMRRRLAAVGRMAFTNYISQSLICSFIFYGHGLSLFGAVSRTQQLLLVVLIWALQLWWSERYLRHFRQGPLEWLWRRLTYSDRHTARPVS